MKSLASIIVVLLVGVSSFLSSASRLTTNCVGQTSEYLSALRDYNRNLSRYYDRSVSPTHSNKKIQIEQQYCETHNSTTMRLYIDIMPTFMYFDDNSGDFDIYAAIFLAWKDMRLTTCSPALGKFKTMRIKNYKIWVPDIISKSSGTFDSEGFIHMSTRMNCRLYPTRGWVECAYNNRFRVKCDTDFTQWPFDRQNCTLEITTWSKDLTSITCGMHQKSVLYQKNFSSNGEWTITNTRQVRRNREPFMFGNRTRKLWTIDFTLDRAHNHLSGLFVTPAIILMAMTMTTVWLDPRSVERLSIASLNIIVHLLCIHSLNWNLPHNGNTIPNILLFYHYSFALATAALLLTFVLSKIQNTKTLPPKWIAALTIALLRCNVGQILLLCMLDPRAAAEIEADADDTGDLVTTGEKQPTWGYVVIILGWICFISYIAAYTIMSITLIPNSSM